MLENLIRLTEALAKMRMRSEAGLWEVTEARRLMEVSTHKAATDSKTGRIDLSRMMFGRETGAQWSEEVMLEVRKVLSKAGSGSRSTIISIVSEIRREGGNDGKGFQVSEVKFYKLLFVIKFCNLLNLFYIA